MADEPVEALVGYISGNVRRKQVAEALSKGVEDSVALGKHTRIPRLSLEKILDEMAGKKIVKKEKDGYKLTEAGMKATEVMKSIH